MGPIFYYRMLCIQRPEASTFGDNKKSRSEASNFMNEFIKINQEETLISFKKKIWFLINYFLKKERPLYILFLNLKNFLSFLRNYFLFQRKYDFSINYFLFQRKYDSQIFLQKRNMILKFYKKREKVRILYKLFWT